MWPTMLWRICKRTFIEWNEDKIPCLGAALAYYSLFSLAPLLIIAIGIASLVFEEPAARSGILKEVAQTFGEPAARATEDVLKYASATGGGTVATVVGVVVLLFGASGVFLQLQDALNTIWKVAAKPGRGLLGMLRDRALSFAVVFGAGLLLLVSLLVSVLLGAVHAFLAPRGVPEDLHLWEGIDAALSLAFLTLLFSLIYKYLPDVKIAWRDVWTGSLFAALLFTGGKYLLGLYLRHSDIASAFGAAGSVVVLLVWVYYSAQIFLLGAEFMRVSVEERGLPIVPTANAVLVTAEARARQGLASSDEITAAVRASQQRQ